MNKVLLLGRLTDNIEPRYTQTNKLVVNFTVAINRPGKSDNQQEQQADFIRCEAWEKTAEILLNYFGKGSRISIEGRIKTGSYEDPETRKKVYTTDVVVERVHFVDTLAESQARQAQQYGQQQQSYQQPQGQQYAQPGYYQNAYSQPQQQGYYGNNAQQAPQPNNYGQPTQSYGQPNYTPQAQQQPYNQGQNYQQPKQVEQILDISNDDLPF